MDDGVKIERHDDEPEGDPDLGHILEWIHLMACHVRQNAANIEKYRKILKTNGETDQRLREFNNWRESSIFTPREKAALSLAESMSLGQSEKKSQNVLKEAKHYFNRDEMVRLTLNIMAINDWIDRHSDSWARILVVEDDPLDRELLQQQLQKARIRDNVIFVPDGRQALATLESYQGGQRDEELIALFLDLRLPRMSGIELLRRIRAMRGMEDLPVIVMTGSNDPVDMEECQKLKVISYVEKPVTFGSFSKAIANIFHPTKRDLAFLKL
jgi:CheY-like chemotaxis protein